MDSVWLCVDRLDYDVFALRCATLVATRQSEILLLNALLRAADKEHHVLLQAPQFLRR